jgi:hypothetical protein
VDIDPTLSPTMTTDTKRLQQVLKNLLSNAFKFTETGGVRLGVAPAVRGWSPDHPILNRAATVIAFEVRDTGIGILPEKQRIIFEAFQQADASTNRKYGGTGLGLAISRELSNLLGGEIQLRSTPATGSTFTLYLPLRYAGSPTVNRPGSSIADALEETASFAPVRLTDPVEAIPDDRHAIEPGDAVLLIVEDDPHYARIIADLAHDQGLSFQGGRFIRLAPSARRPGHIVVGILHRYGHLRSEHAQSKLRRPRAQPHSLRRGARRDGTPAREWSSRG